MELVTTDGNNLKIYFPPCSISIQQHCQFTAFKDPSPLLKHITYLTTFLSTTLQLFPCILPMKPQATLNKIHLAFTSDPPQHTHFKCLFPLVKLLLCRPPAPRTCSHSSHSFTLPSATSIGACPGFLTFPFCTKLWLFRPWPQKGKTELLLQSKASNV